MSRDGNANEQLPAGGSVGAAISNAVVRVMHDYTGRGPTRARTLIGDGVILVVVDDALTKGERRLVEEGDAQTVLAMRVSFQRAMRGDLTDVVEDLSGRRVTAFMSANHVEPDMACEVFLVDRDEPADPAMGPRESE